MNALVIRAGIDTAIVDKIVDKALFPTIIIKACFTVDNLKQKGNTKCEERLISHDITASVTSIYVRKSYLVSRVRRSEIFTHWGTNSAPIHSTRRAVSMLQLVQCFVDNCRRRQLHFDNFDNKNASRYQPLYVLVEDMEEQVQTDHINTHIFGQKCYKGVFPQHPTGCKKVKENSKNRGPTQLMV